MFRRHSRIVIASLVTAMLVIPATAYAVTTLKWPASLVYKVNSTFVIKCKGVKSEGTRDLTCVHGAKVMVMDKSTAITGNTVSNTGSLSTTKSSAAYHLKLGSIALAMPNGNLQMALNASKPGNRVTLNRKTRVVRVYRDGVVVAETQM